MKFKYKVVSSIFLLLSSVFTVAMDIERPALKIGSTLEFGQLMKGIEDENEFEAKADPFYRLGVSLNQTYIANNQFEIRMGVGGLFYNIFPNLSGLNFTEAVRFGPGITVATGIYHFGDIERNNLYLQFGFFPMKYNENATNLGEYLFRSGTYPGLLYTGGPGSWSILNSALYMGQGAQLHWELLDGALTQDITLFFERDNPPMFDLTPSYLIKLNMGGIFQVGFGASFNHLIPMKPSRMRPRPANQENHYVTISGVPDMDANITVIVDEGQSQLDTLRPGFAGGELKGMWRDLDALSYVDAAGNNVLNAKIYTSVLDPSEQVIANKKPIEDLWLDLLTDSTLEKASVPLVNEPLWWDKVNQKYVVESALPADRSNYDSLENVTRYSQQFNVSKYDEGEYIYPREDYYFTYQGIKLMGMAALDFKPLLGNPSFLGPEDLKIFGELAVLGVKDQPLFYDDITQRMPLMFGINLPTFNLLDLLSLQFERYKSPWPNNSRNVTLTLVPTYPVDDATHFKPIESDDWRWSVFAKKKWSYGNFFLQVASDHLRTIWYLDVPTYQPITSRFKDWYYAIRFEYGM